MDATFSCMQLTFVHQREHIAAPAMQQRLLHVKQPVLTIFDLFQEQDVMSPGQRKNQRLDFCLRLWQI